MSVLNKFTGRTLKLNKKRTAVTIIGIILSSALICAVAGMISSFRQTLIDTAIADKGDFHTLFYNVTADEAKYIENNNNVSKYYRAAHVGYAWFEECVRKERKWVDILAFDDNALKYSNANLVEGRYPKNSSEIVLTEKYLKNSNVEYKVGDTVEFTVNRLNRVAENALCNTQEEKLFTKEYKIVGIILDRVNKMDQYMDYTAVTYDDGIDAQYYNYYLTFDDIDEYATYTNTIENAVLEEMNKDAESGQDSVQDSATDSSTVQDGATQDSATESVQAEILPSVYYEKDFNSDYLKYTGASLSQSLMKVVLRIGILVIGIIIITSVFVIRNSFSISTTEKMKQYGVLASVGATSKQIIGNVIYEGLILGAIAIPIGLIIGVVVVYILIFVMNTLLDEALNNIAFAYSISPLVIIATIVLGFVTILLSSLSSARKAAKVSPIDSIRSSQDIKMKGKKLKSPKFIKKYFKAGGDIAYKNLKRSKKKYRTTVVSIIVSVVIFIATSSFIDYGFAMQSVYYEDMSFNTMIYIPSEYTDDQREEIISKLSKMDTVEKYSVVTEKGIDVPKEYYSDFTIENYDKQYGRTIEEDGEIHKSVSAVSLGDTEYRRYIKELGLTYEEASKGGILLDKETIIGEKKRLVGNTYTLKAGDELPVDTFAADGTTKSDITSIEIVCKSEIRPMGLDSTYIDGGYLVISDEMMSKMEHVKPTYMYVYSSDADGLEERIVELTENNNLFTNVRDSNLNRYKRQSDAMILIIAIFLYGFLAVITLIGMTNIFNTITTNMNLRSKEFAMLKSVGMTTKEFNRMIRLESMFYGSKSLIIGVPLGLILSYGMYKGMQENIEMGYILPYRSIILAIVFVFLMIGLIMRYSVKKITNQNIIETIRNDNI